jgi:2'-5' RNA ligase
MELELGGLGAFPNLRRPRVVWMGVKADPKLELLHHDVERACEELGYEVDARAFRPHLTLARVVDDAVNARAVAAAAKSVDFIATVVVESLDLMVSEQGGGRPRYRVTGSAPLTRH